MYSNLTQLEIGQRIREARRNQEATQLQFSEEIFISSNFLSEIENGKKGLSCETLYNICETQKISADYLLFGNIKENEEVSDSELIIETATKMKSDELSVVIDYLKSLKRMREL